LPPVSAPLISFVVPCYNYGRFLPDCLASIFAQEGGYDFEIIAIDDASTDNTSDVLLEFADPRLRAIRHTKNLGHIATVNEGVALARGAFIARIDPDDRYRPHFLATALPKFAEFPEVGLVYGDAALIDDRGEIMVAHSDRTHGGRHHKGNEFIQILTHNIICAPTAIARREAWQRALPIPAGLAFNDWYLNIMMAREWDFYYVDEVMADYRVHASNHHAKIVQDKSEEPSILSLLDRVFRETERSAALERAKRSAKRAIYAAQYLTLADKYFGVHMNSDARRCYLRAIANVPSCAARWDVFRHLTATLIGRTRYEQGKSLARSVFVRG
jgi:glycosyltransferase involved in cell wall biosynthesis